MEARMTYPFAPALRFTGAPYSGFTGTTIPHELLETAESDLRSAIRRNILTARVKRAKPRLHLVSLDISAEPAASEHVFYVIQALYLSNMPRNRRIAERIATLYRDAIAEDEHICPESLSQFRDFFLAHPDLDLPKITVTPDGTLRARWIQGPSNFVALEFVGGTLVKLVAEIPRDNGVTARWFSSESVQSIVSTARAIGALFT